MIAKFFTALFFLLIHNQPSILNESNGANKISNSLPIQEYGITLKYPEGCSEYKNAENIDNEESEMSYSFSCPTFPSEANQFTVFFRTDQSVKAYADSRKGEYDCSCEAEECCVPFDPDGFYKAYFQRKNYVLHNKKPLFSKSSWYFTKDTSTIETFNGKKFIVNEIPRNGESGSSFTTFETFIDNVGIGISFEGAVNRHDPKGEKVFNNTSRALFEKIEFLPYQ